MTATDTARHETTRTAEVQRAPSLARRTASASVVAVAVTLLLTAADHEASIAPLRMLAVLAIGVVAAVIDAQHRRIPNLLTAPTGAAVLASAAVESITRTGLEWSPVLEVTGGGLAAGGALFVLAWFGTMGLGDVKLAAVLGAALVPISGWPFLLVAVAAAYLLAMPHAIIALVARRRGSTDRELPFGPYLVAGAAVATALAWSAPTLGG